MVGLSKNGRRKNGYVRHTKGTGQDGDEGVRELGNKEIRRKGQGLIA